MAGNRYTIANRTTLLKNKLDKMNESIANIFSNSDIQTQEQLYAKTAEILNTFNRELLEPMTPVVNIMEDQRPVLEDFNDIWSGILGDLTILFSELNNLGGLTLANYNMITTDINRLTARLKTISSKFGDYSLYATDTLKSGFYFTDTFNDLTKIDTGSPLINTTECSIDQDQGVITLPINIDANSDISITEKPIINLSSNGTAGNNQESGAAFNGDIMAILDENADTWFEYELVTDQGFIPPNPLTLDMAINLGALHVVNYIRVNPNNLGTQTVIEIDKIETSEDGQSWLSVKEDIQITGLLPEHEDTTFTLCPSSSKYAGQGIYTFTPRQAKYVHFVFTQKESYAIQTPAGVKSRYAIGIRDIYVQGIQYQSQGESISKPFQSLDDIRKILLKTTQNPLENSDLVSIDYLISPDNGSTWLPITPSQQEPIPGIKSTPQVLNFNTVDTNAVTTATPVYSFRLKTKMTRNDDSFTSGSSAFVKNMIKTAEPHETPSSSPYTINLEYPPVDKTVSLVDTMYGSKGFKNIPYYINMLGTSQTAFTIHYPNGIWPVKKVSDGNLPANYHIALSDVSDWVHLSVGGEEWTAVNSLPGTTKSFIFSQGTDPNTYVVTFGNGQTVSNIFQGDIPDSDQPINLWFEPEQLSLSETDNAHTGLLSCPTSNNKENIVIKRYDTSIGTSDPCPQNATIIRLTNGNIIDTTNIVTTLSGQGYTTQKTFINGISELTASTHWSIDTTNGIIYLGSPITFNVLSSFNFPYSYQPIYTLTTDDWDWGQDNQLETSLVVKNTAWQTISVNNEMVITSGLFVDLSQKNIVKGTLNLQATISGVPPASSVDPFVNEASSPIWQNIKENKATISFFPTRLSRNAAFPLSKDQSLVGAKDLQFTSSETSITIPFNRVYSMPLTTVGDYYIDTSSGSVYMHVTTAIYATKQIIMTITWKSATSPNVQDLGYYYVDYRNGQVYTQRSMTGYDITASYEYTDYRISYPIARLVSTDSYTVDIANQQITLKDKELMNRPMTGASNPRYLVNYSYVDTTRESIASLAPYFTPVLKDYLVKIVTASQLY